MFVSTVLAVSFSVVALNTLVAGDPATVITMNTIKVTNNANDYFDPWSFEIGRGQKNSQLNGKMPTKKEVPDNMLFKFFLQMDGQDPIEQVTSFCEALSDETIGKTFVDAGTPDGTFPKECPFTSGDWGISKWDPPSDSVPPGVNGPFSGYVMMFEEGKDAIIQVDFEGEMS
ncbi:uncharacterized protein [Venturia canescens]|uniref:uncharacterized protein n=1 Tax=Venturia canescens TaxID=32260 RepID=UPI001C9D05A2|nr:uncharacterized protein LOC122410433 [Venturia canescens]